MKGTAEFSRHTCTDQAGWVILADWESWLQTEKRIHQITSSWLLLCAISLWFLFCLSTIIRDHTRKGLRKVNLQFCHTLGNIKEHLAGNEPVMKTNPLYNTQGANHQWEGWLLLYKDRFWLIQVGNRTKFTSFQKSYFVHRGRQNQQNMTVPCSSWISVK